MEALTRTILEFGVAALTLKGERESGDRYVVAEFDQGVMVAAIDGLGHGVEAAAAATLAESVVRTHRHESVITVVRNCHAQLSSTRGVVMSLASFTSRDNTMTWLGIGNVEGRLFRTHPAARGAHEFLLLRGGVIGGQLPPLRATVVPVAEGDTLLLFTDGIIVPPVEDISLNQSPQRLAEGILARYAKGTDDAIVLAARWVGKSA